MPVNDPDVGVAFALVIGAGAATALGAAVVFFPSLVKLASRRVLASALGLSSGVMTYVSFVEVFNKANSSFLDAGFNEKVAYSYTTLCFFAGVVVMLLIDCAVKIIAHHGSGGGGGGDHHHHDHHDIPENADEEFTPPSKVRADAADDRSGSIPSAAGDLDSTIVDNHHRETTTNVTSVDNNNNGNHHPEDNANEGVEMKHESPQLCICSEDPVGDLDELHRMADEVEHQHDHTNNNNNLTNTSSNSDDSFNEHSSYKPKDEAHDENRKLVKMGINTAIAIGLHNFPEGLATFVASLEDPRVGAILAVAIGIHNIPEGLCVALPIYYATGNRCKAFSWALLSGISEPIAALLGWAILANNFSDTLYAVLFGIVAGMMVMICCRELLPTAHRYDPNDSVVTYSFIIGMVIIALSLVLFQL